MKQYLLPGQKGKAPKRNFTGGDDFFVFVGDIHPRHHLIPILKAYSIFKNGRKAA
jgi:hypothetical protein